MKASRLDALETVQVAVLSKHSFEFLGSKLVIHERIKHMRKTCSSTLYIIAVVSFYRYGAMWMQTSFVISIMCGRHIIPVSF